MTQLSLWMYHTTDSSGFMLEVRPIQPRPKPKISPHFDIEWYANSSFCHRLDCEAGIMMCNTIREDQRQ